MDKIDIIYYINLAHREDRKKEFLDWIAASEFPEEKISRIDAIYVKEFGQVGCTSSHIKAIEEFINSPFNNCIIFEDDYEPVNRSQYWENIRRFFLNMIDYDLLLLAHNALHSTSSEYEGFEKVLKSATSSGYLITKDFAPKLLENLKEGVELLKKTKDKHKYSLDIWWNRLFENSQIYSFKNRIGFQRGSFSDIENKWENYNV